MEDSKWNQRFPCTPQKSQGSDVLRWTHWPFWLTSQDTRTHHMDKYTSSSNAAFRFELDARLRCESSDPATFFMLLKEDLHFFLNPDYFNYTCIGFFPKGLTCTYKIAYNFTLFVYMIYICSLLHTYWHHCNYKGVQRVQILHSKTELLVVEVNHLHLFSEVHVIFKIYVL